MSDNRLVIKSTKHLAEIIENSISVDRFVLGELKKEEKEFIFYIYGKECKFKLEEFYFGGFSRPYIMFMAYTDQNIAISLSDPIYLPTSDEIESFKMELEKFNNPVKFYGNYFSLCDTQSEKNDDRKPTLCEKYQFKFKSHFELELHFLAKALKEYNVYSSFNEFITDCFISEGNANLYSFLDEDIRRKSDIAEKYSKGGNTKVSSIIDDDDVKTIRNIREKMISKNF